MTTVLLTLELSEAAAAWLDAIRAQGAPDPEAVVAVLIEEAAADTGVTLRPNLG